MKPSDRIAQLSVRHGPSPAGRLAAIEDYLDECAGMEQVAIPAGAFNECSALRAELRRLQLELATKERELCELRQHVERAESCNRSHARHAAAQARKIAAIQRIVSTSPAEFCDEKERV